MQKDHSRMTTTKDHAPAPAAANHQTDQHSQPRPERAPHDRRESHDKHDQEASRDGVDVSAFAALGLFAFVSAFVARRPVANMDP